MPPVQTPEQVQASAAGAGLNAAQEGTVLAGQGYTSTPTPPTAPAIAADSLTQPVTPIVPPAALPAAPNYGAALSSVPTIDSVIANSQGVTAGTKSAGQTIKDSILGVLAQMGTKTAAQQTAEANAGLPDLTKQLTDVNSQIKTLQDEASAIPLNEQGEFEGTGATNTSINTQSNALLRVNSIKALGLSAIASTLQGNITLAQQQADKAVSLEFDPLQSELDYLKQALTFNQDDLTDEEKTQATELQSQLQDRQDQLDQAKADRTTVNGYILSAGHAGAPAALLQQAQTMSPTDAVALLQPYLKNKPISVSPGATIVDPDTGLPIYTAPTTASQNGTGDGSVTFSPTQLNKGAANAGASISDFKALDSDTKNYFVNGMASFNALKKQVDAGQMTKDQAAKYVQDSTTVPDAAKPYLYTILGVEAPADDTSGGDSGGSSFGSIFSGAAGAVGKFLSNLTGL